MSKDIKNIIENEIEVVNTVQEETSRLVDFFDSWIKPLTVWRNNNNKIFLILKSIAGGIFSLRNSVLSLKYRFDARYCSDKDLESAMFIVGEKRIRAKSSLARVFVQNVATDDDGNAKENLLKKGKYKFTSEGGDEFYYVLTKDTEFAGDEFSIILFASTEIGARYIETDKSNIPVEAVGLDASGKPNDGNSLDIIDFEFAVFENSQSLGRDEETMAEVRQRLLTDTARQDSLKELENELKALPTIFDCRVLFNPNLEPTDILTGIKLQPKELLLIVNGFVDDVFADTVCNKTCYSTHKVLDKDVVYYNNPLLAGGSYPVYYMPFTDKKFYITLHYKYEVDKFSKKEIEKRFLDTYFKYRSITQHIDCITEYMLYSELNGVDLKGIKIMKLYLQDSNDINMPSVPTINFGRYEIPRLQDITFVAEEM